MGNGTTTPSSPRGASKPWSAALCRVACWETESAPPPFSSFQQPTGPAARPAPSPRAPPPARPRPRLRPPAPRRPPHLQTGRAAGGEKRAEEESRRAARGRILTRGPRAGTVVMMVVMEEEEAAGGGGGAGPGCGCKGIRSCLLCEGPAQAAPPPQGEDNFTYCPATGLAKGNEHSEFAGWAFPFPGVFLTEEFISEEEESEMVELMDQDEWKPSQSGRKKQDYGPKVNFKKQRLKAGSFTGLPSFSKKIVTQMKACSVLGGFLPVEQCNLDYRPERGSAIDPHFDDWWLWGERLVSLNLLSKTVLSMSCDSEDSIQLFPTFSKENGELSPSGSLTETSACKSSSKQGTDYILSPRLVPSKEVTVAIHLPRRSLVVLYGDARYKWKHAIYRKHIEHRRICVTFRELSAEFSTGGRHEELGKELLEIALSFQGTPV
ncbi:alpha-ketoglutarate-dependent dioxygenase alkB homolog 4 [Cygnus olor]|uniref:alpha-ketoglutarate-dependent dioxygenase alkB homolog 4 n=1 Tax=Cygnus olor TaxID=8869 RepID=UPI001ADEAC1C|nr:alpha-ketoglutarate-dependent dioxygenase alkB homolog 4 [Cygnus olor]